MNSLHTNTAAIATLNILRSINRSLDETQERIATGYRINEAADNAAYWSISITMRGDIRMLDAVQDSLEIGAAVVDTASAGMEASIKVVDEIKAKLVMAAEPGVDKSKINKELTELKNQLRSIVLSSSFNGQNWLASGKAGVTTDRTIVSGFVREANGAVRLRTMTYGSDSVAGTTDVNDLIDYSGNGGSGILTSGAFAAAAGYATPYALLKENAGATTTEIALDANTTATQIAEMTQTVDSMLQQMTDVGASLGSLKSRVESQLEFQKKLSDTLTIGVGRLVDADMNEESARLKALQAQQQLAIQALQIANSAPDVMLMLFR